MVNQIKKALSPEALEAYKSIVSEASAQIADDEFCKEVISSNSREVSFGFLSFKKKGYALDGFVDRVEASIETTDSALQALNELAKTFGDSMEKIMTREALELAFPT